MDHFGHEDTSLGLSLVCGLPIIGDHHQRKPISIDVSLALRTSNEDRNNGAGSPKARASSTVTSFSTTYSSKVKREKDEYIGEEVEVEKKKLRLTKEQSRLLEDSFKEHGTPNQTQKQALANQLNLRPRQVEVWFQNRRARTKLKQTEIDYKFLKRCCEELTNENRRLRSEVNELRAQKVASTLHMQFPAATLKMCPSCDDVSEFGASPLATVSNQSRPFTHSAAC